jgi:hypothetical protein
MENMTWLDAVVGGVAIAIVIGGLVLLFQGVRSINK